MDMMMMQMTFYWGYSTTLLFDSWTTSSALSYYLSLLAVFVFAILHEWLFEFRSGLTKVDESHSSSHHGDGAVPFLKKLPTPKGQHKTLLVTLLYGINAGTGYLLMLLVMSFNGGVLLAVVFGLTVGYGAFRSLTAGDSQCSENLHP